MTPALCLAITAIPPAADGSDLKVWVETRTVRVRREDPPGAGLSVRLSAARNEWESFQILLRSDEGVKGIRVELDELRGPSGGAIPPDEARLYRQHQLHLSRGTYRNKQFQPGWYPDPLIPFRDPAAGRPLDQGRIRAVPFDLPPGQTHGFWVDLRVPPDAPAGEYRGVCRIIAENRRPVEVPVTLVVWDFTLPRVSSLRTAFGSPAGRMRAYYRQRAQERKEPEPKDWEAVEAQCAEMLSRHRMNATPPSAMIGPAARPHGGFSIPSDRVRALREFVDRHHVNAIQIPHPSQAVKDPEREADRLHAWLRSFDRAAAELERPQVIFYTYLKDEPNTEEDYKYVQKWGKAVRAAGSVVKVLVVEQPWTEPGRKGADSAWGDLYGAVDIWCPLFSLFKEEPAAKRKTLGETIWTYTALCQGDPTPWWHIDYPLLNYRAPSWIAWRYGITGLLYWGGMSHWKEVDDPWEEAPYYRGKGAFQQGDKGIVFFGEGSLVYPARAVGYDGIVPTIRLKALRDGIEDYEYMAILERAGKGEQARKLVLAVAESWFRWEADPSAYESARARLASLIEGLPKEKKPAR